MNARARREARRKRERVAAGLTDAYREPFATVAGESVALNVNPNRGKHHLSTLGHKDPRVTNGRAAKVKYGARKIHRPVKPRAHKSVAWMAADLYRTSDAFRYGDAPKS